MMQPSISRNKQDVNDTWNRHAEDLQLDFEKYPRSLWNRKKKKKKKKKKKAPKN